MNSKRPTPRALDGVGERIDQLPAATTPPYSSLDLTDPIQRFTMLCHLDEWAQRFGQTLDRPVEAELQELAPIIAEIELTPSEPRPTSGPLADELAKLDAEIERLGGVRDRTEPLTHDPDLTETLARFTFGFTYSQVVYDNRPEQGEINARHRWFRQPENLSALAKRLGYEVS